MLSSLPSSLYTLSPPERDSRARENTNVLARMEQDGKRNPARRAARSGAAPAAPPAGARLHYLRLLDTISNTFSDSPSLAEMRSSCARIIACRPWSKHFQLVKADASRDATCAQVGVSADDFA